MSPTFRERGQSVTSRMQWSELPPITVTPLSSGVTVVGGSSDHCILDVTDCPRSLQVGDTVSFALRYSHLLYLSGREDVRQAFMR